MQPPARWPHATTPSPYHRLCERLLFLPGSGLALLHGGGGDSGEEGSEPLGGWHEEKAVLCRYVRLLTADVEERQGAVEARLQGLERQQGQEGVAHSGSSGRDGERAHCGARRWDRRPVLALCIAAGVLVPGMGGRLLLSVPLLALLPAADR